MNNKCYNVIVKFIRESEDISVAACTCLAGSSIKCLGKCNHVGAILFALEDFNRKDLKAYVKSFTCTSQLLKWNVPHDSSTILPLLIKLILKKLNLVTIRPQKLNQKISFETRSFERC